MIRMMSRCSLCICEILRVTENNQLVIICCIINVMIIKFKVKVDLTNK